MRFLDNPIVRRTCLKYVSQVLSPHFLKLFSSHILRTFDLEYAEREVLDQRIIIMRQVWVLLQLAHKIFSGQIV